MPGIKQERRIWKEELLRLCEVNPLKKAPPEAQKQKNQGRAPVPGQYLRESEKAATPYLETQ